MRILKRFILAFGIIFLLLAVFLAATVFVVKHLRIKDIVEYEIEQELGINVTIKEITFSPFLAHVAALGVTVHNPKGFPSEELAYINAMHFTFDPIEILFQRKPNIYLFTIDIERLNVIRNVQKKINIKELIPDKEQEDVSKEQTPFYFDAAVVSISQVNFIDYSSGHKKEHHYPVKIKNATFLDLKNGSDVVRLVISEAINCTDIGKLIHVTFAPVDTTVSAVWNVTNSGVKGVWDIVKMPFDLLRGK
ncbi:MAG: AsmA family protein [Oscillospiraceae bacterium]|jgi:uncharacterized protein involved in outer membrane biogenesis